MLRLLALLLVLAAPLHAEEVVLGLSKDEIAITATFDGSDILIFGAVKREAPIPQGAPLEVVVTVAGPKRPVTVRQKARQMGIWANARAHELEDVPSFYAVASTGPLAEVFSAREDARYKVSIRQAVHSISTAGTDAAQPFTDALIRIRMAEGLYNKLEGEVALDQQTLFRTRMALPSNLTEGNYSARIFLTREGEVVDFYQAVIPVRKVGLERWLYALAHEQPLLYGLLSLAIAIAAGWGASAAFGLLRR